MIRDRLGSTCGAWHSCQVWCRRSWTIRFQLESRGFPEVEDVLNVPELRTNFLSVSALRNKGYAVLFQKGQVFMRLEGASLDTIINIGVREGRVYRLQG